MLAAKFWLSVESKFCRLSPSLPYKQSFFIIIIHQKCHPREKRNLQGQNTVKENSLGVGQTDVVSVGVLDTQALP